MDFHDLPNPCTEGGSAQKMLTTSSQSFMNDSRPTHETLGTGLFHDRFTTSSRKKIDGEQSTPKRKESLN